MLSPQQRYCNPPGSPIFSAPHRALIRELCEFTVGMLGIGVPTLTKTELDRLPAATIQREMVAHNNSITWLGHASFFVRLDGINILLDPFLSARAASMQPFGIPRMTPPALTVDQLPPIDMVMMSHSHYDHCDRATLKALADKETIRVLVPAGLGAKVRSWGLSNTTELLWGIRLTRGRLTTTFVPAIHHSRRTLFDYNTTLWGGFILHGSRNSIYFAGDTAYGPVFAQMGPEYGPIDYGLVPIGGYGTNEKLRSVHATPEDAVNIGRDMKCSQLIGMHWGALKLTSEPPLEPRIRFLAAGAAQNIATQTMILGQTIAL